MTTKEQLHDVYVTICMFVLSLRRYLNWFEYTCSTIIYKDAIMKYQQQNKQTFSLQYINAEVKRYLGQSYLPV